MTSADQEGLKAMSDARSFYGPVTGFHDLNMACRLLSDAFGPWIFLVGSAMERRDYRDVDVRCMLDDATFDGMFPGALPPPHAIDARLLALNLSISAYLAHHSGLPVDFQFQRLSDANTAYGDRPRNALGTRRWHTSSEAGATPSAMPESGKSSTR